MDAPKFSNKGDIVGKLSKRRDVKSSEGLAAWLGRRKMGAGSFTKRAAAAKHSKYVGKKRKG